MKWAVILFLGSFVVEATLGWTYHTSRRTLKWADARRFCQETYTDMVVIQSQEENDYLVSKMPNRTRGPHYWIGITRKSKEDAWTWIGNNSTWVGEQSWAPNEPNNDHATEFCVEIYVIHGDKRGKWNDEKCSSRKFPICFKAQCHETSCVRGRCWETMENTTCLCETGFEGHRCEKARTNNQTEEIIAELSDSFHLTHATMEPEVTERSSRTSVPSVTKSRSLSSLPDNGYLGYTEGSNTLNSSCQRVCYLGSVAISSLPCELTGAWNGTGTACETYKLSVLASLGAAALSTVCCTAFCCMKRRKRKKLQQTRSERSSSAAPSTHALASVKTADLKNCAKGVK